MGESGGAHSLPGKKLSVFFMSDQEVDLGMSQEEVASLAHQFGKFVTMENLPPDTWQAALQKLLIEAVSEGMVQDDLACVQP